MLGCGRLPGVEAAVSAAISLSPQKIQILRATFTATLAADTAASTSVELHRFGRFCDDFIKPRVVAKVVPKRVQLKVAGG